MPFFPKETSNDYNTSLYQGNQRQQKESCTGVGSITDSRAGENGGKNKVHKLVTGNLHTLYYTSNHNKYEF